jgi:hypothetical protein
MRAANSGGEHQTTDRELSSDGGSMSTDSMMHSSMRLTAAFLITVAFITTSSFMIFLACVFSISSCAGCPHCACSLPLTTLRSRQVLSLAADSWRQDSRQLVLDIDRL